MRPRQRSPPQPKKDREAELHYITRHGVRLQIADLHITSVAGQKPYVPEILPACRTQLDEPIAVYRMSKFKLEPELWTWQFWWFRLYGMAIFFLLLSSNAYWWRRFHQLPMVGIEQNLVCSFLTSFPRTVFGFIPKFSFFQNLWQFLKAHDFTHMGYLVKAISTTSIGWNKAKFGMRLSYTIP